MGVFSLESGREYVVTSEVILEGVLSIGEHTYTAVAESLFHVFPDGKMRRRFMVTCPRLVKRMNIPHIWLHENELLDLFFTAVSDETVVDHEEQLDVLHP